tara:strand:+ start:52607 stop:52828 length:222 start_codon:yes stop_codon:yes gene_type:complete
LSAYSINGFAFAAGCISGKYFERGRIYLLKKSIKVAFQIAIAIGLFGSLMFLVFDPYILELLTDKEEVSAYHG